MDLDVERLLGAVERTVSSLERDGLRRDNQPETSASIRMRRGKAAARNGGRA